MSEQKTNYMSQLDGWTERNVIEPLQYAVASEGKADTEAIALIKKVIREKVLESYRNGQTAKTNLQKERVWKK